MKYQGQLFTASILAIAFQSGYSIPVLSGDGIEPVAANGSFGTTGTIFEYRVQGSTGLAFTASQAAGVDALRLSYTFTAALAIAHGSAAVYLDADINQDANTWFNERGEALVAAGGAESWEIDEPGIGASYVGDIYAHYGNGIFDNSVFDGQSDLVEDAALGLGFDFGNLEAGDRLDLEILLSESAIGLGWGTVLHQWDNDDGLASDNLYFAGRFSILRAAPPDPGPTQSVVSEPGALVLFGLGLAALMAARRRIAHF